jgi:hypothetical protein
MRAPRSVAPSVSPQTPESNRVRNTSPRRVALLLWGLLALSLLFLGAVQNYVGRVERATYAASDAFAEAPSIPSEGPDLPVPANSLELRWAPVSDATRYHLRILTDRNAPVLDPVEVWTTTWRPAYEMLPGFVQGRYRWSVEALDASSRVVARSAWGTFEVS